jgi:hypothetical protein
MKKKVIIITLLMTVITALFIGGGVCYADESPTNYYYVAKGNELPARFAPNEDSKVALHIPSTYAFEYVEKVDTFVKIKYNGIELFVSEVYLNQYCKPVTSKWGDSPYFHTVSFTTSNISVEQITLYDKENRTPLNPIPKNLVSIGKVYGYCHSGNDYYFLAEVTVTLLTSETEICYIKATDTTLADFNKESIADSAGYIAETKPDEQIPDDESDPTLKPGNSGDNPGTLPATNNFERYVLIAVIAVLCIVIIILIFAPNKSKRKS